MCYKFKYIENFEIFLYLDAFTYLLNKHESYDIQIYEPIIFYYVRIN